jgi:hypothetical protein
MLAAFEDVILPDVRVGLNTSDVKNIKLTVNSTLSDYMITIFKDRHSGMDCRNPVSMDGFELTIHGTGYPLPGGYDEFAHNLTK